MRFKIFSITYVYIYVFNQRLVEENHLGMYVCNKYTNEKVFECGQQSNLLRNYDNLQIIQAVVIRRRICRRTTTLFSPRTECKKPEESDITYFLYKTTSGYYLCIIKDVKLHKILARFIFTCIKAIIFQNMMLFK